MKISEAQRKVLRQMGTKRNALVNGDEGTPQWWIEGGYGVHGNVARALLKRKLIELTGREGGHPGVLFFTATLDGRAAARQMEVPASAKVRIMAFLSAFHGAPNNADIEVRAGKSEAGEAAILVSISGGGDHALMIHEARKVADIMEDAMKAHPDDPESRTLPNIIMALRAGCDQAASSATPQ